MPPSIRSRAARIAATVALIALAIVLFLLLRDGDDETAQPPAAQPAPTGGRERGGQRTSTLPEVTACASEITVRSGQPVGGVQELGCSHGDRVRIAVRSDIAEEVHVHGYDRSREVPAGGSTTLTFVADIEGAFEVELERSHVQIAELRVQPD